MRKRRELIRLRRTTYQEDDERGDYEYDEQHHDTESLLLVGCYQLVLHNLTEDKCVIYIPWRSVAQEVKMMSRSCQDDI